MKKFQIHILVILLIHLFSFVIYSIYRNYNVNIPAYDFWFVQAIQYGYSNIFKEYFFDFFNSFYIYNAELGYDHSYYHFSHLNPFYFLSFFGLADYSIKLSNLFAVLSAAFFLFRIAKILNLNWIKTYFLTLFPTLFISLYGHSFNHPIFNGYMFIWLYVLFFFDLNNRSINYFFYIFYFILASLTSSFVFPFLVGILFLILSFFYKYKKEHKFDLIFFFISNIIIWFIAISPYLLVKSDLSTIYIKDILKTFFIIFFIFGIFFFKKKLFDFIKKIKLFFSRNNLLKKVFLSCLILLIVYCIYLLFKDLWYYKQQKVKYVNIIFDLFAHNKSYNIISFFLKEKQFDLINEVREGSGIFLFIPKGLLAFTLFNYQRGSKYFEITFISIIAFISMTLIYNSELVYDLTGARLLRDHLNFIPIILMMFIYFNLLDKLEKNKNNYLFGKNNFNRNLLLFPALIFDFFSISQSTNPVPYLFILFLYLPFILLFFKNFYNYKKVSFSIIFLFLIIQPFMNIAVIRSQYENGPSLWSQDINQYNAFINCFKTKSNYDKFDRVLATGTHETMRNYIGIMSLLTERERGTDINILYQYREVFHPKLANAYNNLLDYKYYGTSLFPPAFYNITDKKYFFKENFFDELGISSVMVFNDNEKKFPLNYKSFSLMGSCQTKLYNADIYKSNKPRGSALVINNEAGGGGTKINNITKNSWDLSKINNVENGTIVLTFAEYSNTKIFIDDEQQNFRVVKGKFLIPYKNGQVLKIIYQNDYHKIIFILVILEYLIIFSTLGFFIYKIFFKKMTYNKSENEA
jgi:hypothetical protein